MYLLIAPEGTTGNQKNKKKTPTKKNGISPQKMDGWKKTAFLSDTLTASKMSVIAFLSQNNLNSLDH